MKIYQQLFLLFLLCFCTFFIHIDRFFPELMELRNFVTAREMIQEGHWWNTTMNLEPRLEKPPLPTWLTALSGKYLGGLDNLYAMRLPAALAGTALVLFIFGFCRSMTTEKYLPLLGASVAASCLMILEMARQNTWDIYTHAFMIGSIWQYIKGIKSGQWRYHIWAAILFGLSVMSKGPVSLYALWLPFVLAFGIKDRFTELKANWKPLLFILLLGCVIGFFWNAAMLFNQEEAAVAVMDKETSSWANRHVRPFYFYLHFPLFTGIWMIPLLASFFYKFAAPRINAYGNYRFILFWALISIILLSIIPEKKERYLLPAMIPLCLLIAYLVYAIWQQLKKREVVFWDRFVFGSFSNIIHLAAISIPFLLVGLAKEYLDTGTIVFSILLALSGMAGIYFWYHKKYMQILLNIFTLVCLFCFGMLPFASDWVYQYDEFRSLEEIQKEPELANCPVYTEKEGTDPRVVWLCGKPTHGYGNIDLEDASNYPFVFITFGPIEYSFDQEFLASIEVVPFGQYDIRRKNVRWKPLVYLLKQKEKSES